MLFATQIILCATTLGNIALLALLAKERRSSVQNVFILYVLGIAGWTFSILINLWLKSCLVEACIFAFAALFLTVQLWFVRLFTQEGARSSSHDYWIIAVGAFFIISSFWRGALFTSITVHAQGYTTLTEGFLSGAYSLFALSYVCAPLVLIIGAYRRASSATRREQLAYLAIGFFLFAAVNVLTNSVLPVFFGIFFFNAIGPAFSLFLAAAVFYIIRQHQFLDIRAAVQRSVTYSLLLALVIALYSMMLALVETTFSVHAMIAAPISAGATMLIGIFSIPLIERQFRRVTDRLFFKERYDYPAALQALTEILHTSADFDELIARIETSLAGILRAEYVAIRLHNDARDAPLETAIDRDIRDSRKLYEHISIDSREIAGILVGDKRSGDRYNQEDRQLLRTFSLQAATALARAQLFRQVEEYASGLEEKVAARTEELRRAQKAQEQLMLDIAHSLQTPLALFQNKIEQLKQMMPEKREMAGLEHSLGELSTFIYDLLVLARLEREVSPERIPVAISALVAELADEITIIAAPRSIAVECSVAPGIMVVGDQARLREACMNILSNALKYMGEGAGKAVSICLTYDSDRATATIEIRDTGIGIEPSELPHIFDRFYRSRRVAGGISGTGLGLAITKRIVELHGGTISVSSAPGAGTTVWIMLPAATTIDPRA